MELDDYGLESLTPCKDCEHFRDAIDHGGRVDVSCRMYEVISFSQRGECNCFKEIIRTALESGDSDL